MSEQRDAVANPTSITIHIQAPNGQRGEFPVEYPTVSVGKDPANNIRLNHPEILDFHLGIEFADGTALISIQNPERSTYLDTLTRAHVRLVSDAEWHADKVLYLGPFQLWYDAAANTASTPISPTTPALSEVEGSHQPSTTSHQPPTTSHQQLATSHQQLLP